jgi:uncharacterized protein YndB with AHSA1/START domain
MTTEIRPIEADDALGYEVRIAAPPALVWRFWTEPERLVRWMGDVATLEPQPGGAFRLEYKSGDVAAGSFVEVDAPRRLVFTWGWEAPGDPVPAGGSTIEVMLEPLDDGAATLLRLRHSGLPQASRDGHDEGWRYFLGRLVEAAAGA